MKKAKLIWVITISVLFLAACTRKVEPTDVDTVSLNMSQQKVKKLLGNPKESTTDRKKLIGIYDTYSMLYTIGTKEKSNIGYSDKYGVDEKDDYFKTFKAINSKNNVEVFEYETTKKDSKIIVYFIDNKVSFFYNIDL